eukprot:scaffold3269_cov80-Skeletonema_marinoi.AAC.3
MPSDLPSTSGEPSSHPSLTPSESAQPSSGPSSVPSSQPSSMPSISPNACSVADGFPCGVSSSSTCENVICCSGNSVNCPGLDRYCGTDCPIARNFVSDPPGEERYGDGLMFEMKARSKDVAITSLATKTYALRDSTTGTFGVEVWTKSGTMVGYESDVNAWTKIADKMVTATRYNMLQLPDFVTPVQIPAGQIQSFYVTHKNCGKASYAVSLVPFNTLAKQDDNLQLFSGYWREYPFGFIGTEAEARTWNGVMTYVTKD